MTDKKTILLVDDDEAHLLWAKEVLGDEGYEIISTHSAKIALELLQTKAVDLIISDLVMPEMSGIELVRKVAEIRKGQKAIILTGHGDIDTFIESVYNLGALEYIVKPVEPDAFVSMVAKLTSGSADDVAVNG